MQPPARQPAQQPAASAGPRIVPISMEAPEYPTDAQRDGTVVEVMQAGYTIGDRVLRPALVAVSKGGVKQAPPKKPAQGGNGFGPGGPANDDIPEGGD